ncbi:MAG: SLBB domain-containing protein [Candidatus Dormibacteraeota bacterium]|nr:SLBB domain-containing protein [Candidatus Dormibacteraeota bacterium]
MGARPRGERALIDTLDRSALVGRGGASFPVGTKWRSVESRSRGAAVVIANGAEGEPLSRKDQTLMALRPHLVIDGALLAAESVAANRVLLYVGEAHGAAMAAIGRALAERPAAEIARASLVPAPPSYVAGEETAAVHFVNSGVATPTAIPPRPFERGVEGRPTLIQNVETLAHVALIARYGDAWFHSLGRHQATGTILLTVGGAVARPGVIEVASGCSVDEALALAGGVQGTARAVLLGGYFGGWIDASQAGTMVLDPKGLRAAGGSLGCGVVSVLDAAADPLEVSARIMQHLANESSAQCGPCFFGLRSLSAETTRLANRRPEHGDLPQLHRWAEMVQGRGACRHPDGAVAFLQSALNVFGSEFTAAAGVRGRRAS